MRSQCDLPGTEPGHGALGQRAEQRQHGLVTSPAIGNNSSHQWTKVPKQACKERPPDMDKAQRQQQFFKHFKPCAGARVGEGSSIKAGRTKIMLLFSLDKRQQLAQARAGPGELTRRLDEDAATAQVGAPKAPPTLRGAGDGAERCESARARETKLLVLLLLLLLLDARLQEVGRRAAGGARVGGGAKAAQGWPRLYARLLTENPADRDVDLVEEQPCKRRRCPRPRL
uniref:Uncharacterized protein n=1 Tax=Sus scrofa TaxID=9823 RepID=A0A8D1B2B1_PIG